MHALFRRQLIERFLPFNRLNGYAGLFFCALSFPLNRPLFLLPAVP